MELVVDANVIISALISSSGKTAEMLFSDKLKLYAPEYLLEEIGKHGKYILEKSGLSPEEMNMLLSLISSNIELISFLDFKKFIKQASKICPDENDTEYFALALKIKCDIWSNDEKLKEQDKINVYSTKELIGLF